MKYPVTSTLKAVVNAVMLGIAVGGCTWALFYLFGDGTSYIPSRPILYVHCVSYAPETMQDVPAVQRIIHLGLVSVCPIFYDTPNQYIWGQSVVLPMYEIVVDGRAVFTTLQPGLAEREIKNRFSNGQVMEHP